jgi:hypothetical protein
VPELGFTSPLQLFADLRIEFSSEHGDASAHLHGGSDGLVLDVDNPAVLVNQVRGQELPLRTVRDVISDTPVRVRSAGRDLARLRLTPAGKVRVRPTPVGLLLVPRVALSSSRGRLVAAVIGLLSVAAAVAGFRRPATSR